MPKRNRPSDDESNAQPPSLTDEESTTLLRLLGKLRAENFAVFDASPRPIRKELSLFMSHFQKKMWGGFPTKAEYHENKRQRFASKHESNHLKLRRLKKAALDRRAVDNAALRRGRIAQLEAMNEFEREAAESVLRVPDGAVRDGVHEFRGVAKGLVADVAHSVERLEDDPDAVNPRVEKPKSCYVCKTRFHDLHHFYDQFCPDCAEFNWKKRLQTSDLQGRTAVVTGGRVKIGYHIALKLLRAGCVVIVTTRFPKDASVRFRHETDFSSFSKRLHVYAMDLKDIASIEEFCAFVSTRFNSINILINNACQTIRRPKEYYAGLLEDEAKATKTSDPLVLNDRRALVLDSVANAETRKLLNDDDDVKAKTSDALFPRGEFDQSAQQVDLRKENSWVLKLDQVSTREVAEVVAVNALAPFILMSKLKPCLLASPKRDRYVINVSAMEGKFSRHKNANHPHTNAAKSFLNMVTRTSAQDYLTDRIFMNSVDTGWNSQENPLHVAARIATEHNFQTPIDEIDGAARVLDPVFVGSRLDPDDVKGRHWGLFLKDYRPTTW